ncbi:response regulator [Massilia sp. CMS3.1]|uniref:response regulator n=1 Tax=Massilia sp. CMS3.1 TaxID=3373083 RepID=UPI003EE79A2A
MLPGAGKVQPKMSKRSSKTVLVVDDNADAADMTAQLLQMYGLDVQVAYGGPEGLAAARANHPYVIFLDIGMPVMDGYQVAQAIRADQTLRGVKLVALTAWGDEMSRKKVHAAGFDVHLTKPANIVELVETAQGKP